MGQFIGQSLKGLYEAKGPVTFREEMRSLIAGKKLDLDKYSIRELAEATNFPVNPDAFRNLKSMPHLWEATDWSTFPILNQEILSGIAMPSYLGVARLSASLVTERESHDDPVRVAARTSMAKPQIHPPGGNKPETTFKEKYVSVPAYDPDVNSGPHSRIMSLSIYDIWFDKTGQIRSDAQKMGEKFAQLEEKEFFYRLQDVSGWYCFYPSGTRTALYSTGTTADTTGLTPRYSSLASNTLTDYTDINNVEAYLHKHTDDNGDPVEIGNTRVLIVPVELEATALLARASIGGDKAKLASLAYPTIAYMIGGAPAAYDVIATRYLSDQSSSTYYWGNPREQFVRLVFKPFSLEATTLGPTSQQFVQNDIVFQCFGTWWKRTIATDYRFVVKGTT